MNSVKLNKKHLFSFALTLVLLFSLNLNTFAVTSNTVCFANADNSCYYYLSSGTEVNCTSTTTVKTSTYVVNDNGDKYNTSVFCFPAIATNYQKLIISKADLDIYTSTKYKFDFYVKLGNTSGSTGYVGIFIFYYVDGEHNSSTTLYVNESISTNTWTNVSGSFQTPDLTGNVTCMVMLNFACNEDSGRYFHITDAAFTLDDPLINGTPIETPAVDSLDDTMADYEVTMDSLPKIDKDQLDDLMNFDFDNFTAGMSFVRDMFDRTMAVFGFNSILVFALTIGLATYIIGRKVG